MLRLHKAQRPLPGAGLHGRRAAAAWAASLPDLAGVMNSPLLPKLQWALATNAGALSGLAAFAPSRCALLWFTDQAGRAQVTLQARRTAKQLCCAAHCAAAARCRHPAGLQAACPCSRLLLLGLVLVESESLQPRHSISAAGRLTGSLVLRGKQKAEHAVPYAVPSSSHLRQLHSPLPPPARRLLPQRMGWPPPAQPPVQGWPAPQGPGRCAPKRANRAVGSVNGSDLLSAACLKCASMNASSVATRACLAHAQGSPLTRPAHPPPGPSCPCQRRASSLSRACTKQVAEARFTCRSTSRGTSKILAACETARHGMHTT